MPAASRASTLPAAPSRRKRTLPGGAMIDLSTLNPQQRAAVEQTEGPLLILAGAGSGKTRVVTYRIAHLLQRGVRPENILALSFTNKAAEEMRERVAGLVPPQHASKVQLSTFHALGLRMLHEDIHRLGYRRPFGILDESDRFRALKTALEDLRLSGTGANDARLLQLISRAKNADSTPAQLPEARYDPSMPRAQRVFLKYAEVLRNLNAVDFDDLLLLPLRLLRDHGDLREKYRQRYRYVMVDEYQDTNAIQLQLLEQLVAPPAFNLAVVGDDDQSIYAFRGAVSDNILHFDRLFPNTRVITLDQSYRSVQSILSAANAVIARNEKRREKRLWSDLGEGRPPRLFVLETQTDEADFIAQRVLAQRLQSGRPWSDFAVLYRVNPQAQVLEESLRAAQVPYRIVGGKSAFDRKEIRDAMAWLRLLVHPEDDLSLRRILHAPPRGIGAKTIATLDDRGRTFSPPRLLWSMIQEALHSDTPGLWNDRARKGAAGLVEALERSRATLRSAAPGAPLPALLESILEDVGLLGWIRSSEQNPLIAKRRIEGVRSFLDGAGRYREGGALLRLELFLTRVTLDGPGVEEDEDAGERVTLMTFHASKGLEFPVVYMVGMNEELLPHARSIDTREGIAEERRLCYVGMTRAKEQLVLTRARVRTLRNERVVLKPSRFLEDIPETLLKANDLSVKAERSAEERIRTNQEHFDRLKRLFQPAAQPPGSTPTTS